MLQVYLRENDNIDTATSRLLLKHEHHVYINLCKDTRCAAGRVVNAQPKGHLHATK